MAKFLFLYRNADDNKGPEPSPDEMEQIMKSWWDWLGAGQAAGWVLEMGEALTPEGKVVHADASITDGPYAETREMVGGYTLVEAPDMDAAAQHAKGCPIFASGGKVEIRPIMDTTQPG